MSRMGNRPIAWIGFQSEYPAYSDDCMDYSFTDWINMEKEITILAFEIYGHPDIHTGQSKLLAMCDGRKFYVNFTVPTELINDNDFSIIPYLKHLARNTLDVLLKEKG